MIDYSEYLEGYRDAQAYDVEEGGYDADYPLTAQLAQSSGGPLLDLACGTGTMAIRMAELGFQVTGIDIIPEMIERAKQKAHMQGATLEWVVADARTFQLQKQFSFIYMLGNAFQHFLSRADHEALLARVWEHLQPQGSFLFGTRNPSPRNLFETRFSEPQKFTQPDGRQYIIREQQEYDPLTQIQYYTFNEYWLKPEGLQEKKTYHTALRYVFPQEMEALLFYNGFQIRSCYGSWQQEPLTAASREMIYVCQKRS
ncbi:class I SAM-dependent methyltransferase [Ktedonosporobacter rubrisoli]|uniref:Class I SAM-dependent methyltransferase n=1 Tax=Ktedonosporobacter rubrisoli TaxID=2509675 RepID=A0A4P6JNT8_KTERU|nr:class I SAM-dependent methyltransferase [Ktedonosporobacter rubrisoli]QBD76843.1 class I SAM-dependent methyltransferase [Ktedonosporobacter rubrisoli]